MFISQNEEGKPVQLVPAPAQQYDIFGRLRYYNELGDPAPSGYAWIVSLCLVVVLFWACCWMESVVEGFQYARLEESMAFDLVRGASVEKMFKSGRYSPLFNGQRQLIKSLRPLFGMVRNGELSRALRFLEREDTPKHPIFHDMIVRLRAVADDDEEFQKLRYQEQFYNSRKQQFSKEYFELKLAFARLLNRRGVLAEGNDLLFYSYGIFAHLPVLAGIPDNLSAEEHLEVFFDKTTLDDSEQRMKVERDLMQLVNSGELLRRRVEVYYSAELLRNKVFREMDVRHREVSRVVRALLRQLMSELARPKLREEVILRYEIARQILSRYEIDVPELRADIDDVAA